ACRVAQDEAAGRGEPAAQAARGRSVPGQADLAGRALKNTLRPARKRALVHQIGQAYEVSERRACGLVRFSRASHRYRHLADGLPALRSRIKELAVARVAYGYRRIHLLLRREGWQVNHKRVYRIYRQENLVMRTKS